MLYVMSLSVVPQKPSISATSRTGSVLLTSAKVTLTCKTGSTDHSIIYKFQLAGKDIDKSGPGATYVVPTTVTARPSAYTCVAIYNKNIKSSVSSVYNVRFVGKSFMRMLVFLKQPF